MSLSQVIDCIGRREPFRVIRPMGGVDVKGEYQRNPPQDFPATGAIQQADPKMLEKLPEGERSKEALIVFTETELRNVRAAKNGEADILKMRGSEWRVMLLADWSHEGGYYEAVVVRLGQ